MSSAYTLYPSSVADTPQQRRDRMNEPRSLPSNDNQHHISPSTPIANNHLSAFSPQQHLLRSSSSSPALNTHTPAESSTLSVHYQSSEFSADGEDPFFGVNFGAIEGGSPLFMEDEFMQLARNETLNPTIANQSLTDATRHAPEQPGYLPMSPDKTPSLHTPSPNSDRKADRPTFPALRQTRGFVQPLASISTQAAGPLGGNQSGFQFTPENSGSDDGVIPTVSRVSTMPVQSPRLTVSVWGRDGASVPYPLDTDQHHSTFGDLSEDETSVHPPDPISASLSTARDGEGRWVPDATTGQGGVSPEHRSTEEVPTINQLASRRRVDERNQEVGEWVARSASPSRDVPFSFPTDQESPAPRPQDIDEDALPKAEIGIEETENAMKPDQIYVNPKGGELTEQDVEIILKNRMFRVPAAIHGIRKGTRHQPESSQAAIQRWNEQRAETESFVSNAGTWGTRRRSLPSISDFDGITSGNLFKKLSISRDPRRPSLLGGLRNIVKIPTGNTIKRTRTENDDAGSINTDSSADRNSNLPKQANLKRAMSWGIKREVPTITTAVIAMGAGASAVGAAHHARNPSMSGATPTVTSPKSPGGLTVRKPLRIRSISDLTTKKETAGLAEMLRKSGGPPVSNIGKSTAIAGDADDEDDDDDEMYEDAEMRSQANKIIDDITPNFSGFQQHILKLNPSLASTNNYLVDRIAHQQIIRYKSLLNARVKHLQSTANNSCACGTLCIALGGSANVLDSRGDPRGMDPLSTRYDGSDGDITPLEGPGVISQESFPQDIPMPPANILPAEFECQLCFQAKKFQKPSDWTKHVHEDVQPFTCTWDRCRDPKIFKRKADWVRHENEGHRHLEWWDCDVEDCRHVCYRRDNFLQHLVREHKYPEPKVKTKAAIKRAGGLDPTWQKVEQCHKETHDLPQNEPCRFCGKTFPTWKKLTVHLAKHMEQISLPILKLVARKELEADTIISPVQDPPPRPPYLNPAPTKPSDSFGNSPLTGSMGFPMQHPQSQPHMSHPQPQPVGAQGWGYGVGPADSYQPIFGGFNGNGLNGLDNGLGHASNAHPLNIQPVPNTYPVSHGGQFDSIDVIATSQPYGMQGTANYLGTSAPVDFSALSATNALGLQAPNGVMYSPMLDPNSAGTDHQQQHFTPRGSVSPYGHSPHQGTGGFYAQ
ncbi:transcription factor IIIA [Podospora aff. communis PSN243]|uniref:Transcription factor IIIA n=1 Tax=Podospora aff. communis PSN243 TaxID=3040156 RepID=A0AAV9GPB5_9PEZI|nr:transcription factor IIIA [Podospora aff. communis PSN243]